MSWKAVKIGDFLKRSKIPIDIEDSKYYNRVTIRINHNGVSLRDSEIGKKIGTKKQFILKKGQFILSKIDARYGAFGVAPEEVDGAIITGNFWAYDVDESLMNINWLNQYTNSKVFYDLCERASSGITHRKYLNEDFFLNHELLIPEIHEQDSHVFFIKKRKDSIGILENENTHQLDLLKKLRQQILQDAVQGKLVPQDHNDEPASKLLERIKAEKEKLIREKKIKQGKIQEAETQEEILFTLPQCWTWCKLDDISKNITDGTHQTPVYTNSGKIFLSAQNVKPFRFIPQEHKYVSEDTYQEIIKNRIPEKGDILVARVGAGIGEAAVIDHDIDFCFYVSLGLVQPFKQFTNSEFLTLVFNSPYGVKYSKGNVSSKGGSAGNFNLGRIRSFLIPFPPLPEQQRILNKVGELMTLCDDLENSIQQNQKYTQDLLQVALKEALESK